MDIQPEFITRAIEDIAMERKRQQIVEGWTFEHDDKHSKGEMAAAGGCYALGANNLPCASVRATNVPAPPYQSEPRVTGWGPFFDRIPIAWPWDRSWWKPKDRRRDLVRAAALIVAEIERMDRLALSQHPKQGQS